MMRTTKWVIIFLMSILPLALISQTAEDTLFLKKKADFAYDALYGNLDSARMIAQEVYELAKEKRVFKYEMDALSTIAYSYYYNYQFDTALSIFKFGNEIALQRGDTSIHSKFCNAQAMVYEQKADYKSAIFYYKRVVLFSLLKNDSSSLAIGYGNLANAYSSVGEVDSSIVSQNKAITIRERRDDAKVHSNYNNLGTYYHKLGRFDKAMELYLKAAKLRKEQREHNLEAATYGNLSALFSELNDHDNSILYSQKAKVIFEQEGDDSGLNYAYSNIGTEYTRVKDYDNALKYLLLALDGRRKVGDVSSEATDLHNLGVVYDELQQLDKALKYYNQSLSIKEKLGEKQKAIITKMHIGNILSQQNKYAKGEELLLTAYQNAKEIFDLTNQRMVSDMLSEHYQRIGSYKKSLNYRKIESAIKDSIFNKDYTTKINKLYVAYETSRAQQELLKEKVKSQEFEKMNAIAELKVSDRTNLLLVVASGSFILLMLGGFIYYRNKQKEKSRLSKIRIEEQQKGLTAVIQAQEEERKRIAKDLHDGIVQQLGGLKLRLQKVFENNIEDEPIGIIKTLDESSKELRTISHQMMPRALSELGLIPAMEDMLANSLNGANIAYDFENFGMKDRLADNIETAIYRISQELINNVIKHSNATQVSIQLFKSNNQIVFIVEDNGKGISQNNSKKGIGLMNISSRLDVINGKVNYEPSPESGTLVTIKIPITDR